MARGVTGAQSRRGLQLKRRYRRHVDGNRISVAAVASAFALDDERVRVGVLDGRALMPNVKRWRRSNIWLRWLGSTLLLAGRRWSRGIALPAVYHVGLDLEVGRPCAEA